MTPAELVRPPPAHRAVRPRWIAEEMPPFARYGLIRRLVAAGLTDIEIAEQTALTTYTTARIRRSLGLPPNTR